MEANSDSNNIGAAPFGDRFLIGFIEDARRNISLVLGLKKLFLPLSFLSSLRNIKDNYRDGYLFTYGVITYKMFVIDSGDLLDGSFCFTMVAVTNSGYISPGFLPINTLNIYFNPLTGEILRADNPGKQALEALRYYMNNFCYQIY